MQILALDIAGIPRQWVNFNTAITYHAKDMVAWSLGDTIAKYHGGVRNDGTRSYLETPSIIAVKGSNADPYIFGRVALNNDTLFGRDRYMCAYCGEVYNGSKAKHHLSRDHIMPKSKGGVDDWMNVVTACKSCNAKKDNKTLQQARMELLYVPYIPNHFESLIIQNRNILSDQMEYLLSGVPKHSRLN